MLSTTAAASPFMKTDRTSFSAAASPASSETTSTGMPNGAKRPANACAAAPDTSTGAESPRVGMGPSSATSAKPTPASAASAASSRFSSGEAVFASA